mgnify:CR=1 FL=1
MEYNQFMNKLSVYFLTFQDKEMILKSLKISLVVGTILNLINQGELIFALDFVNIDYIKSLLTYMVPFLVSTYTAISIKMQFNIGDVAYVDARLLCKGCQKVIHIHKNEIVPICTKCKEKTKWRVQ